MYITNKMHKIFVIRLYFQYTLYMFRAVSVHLQEQSFCKLYIVFGMCRYVWLLCCYSNCQLKVVSQVCNFELLVESYKPTIQQATQKPRPPKNNKTDDIWLLRNTQRNNIIRTSFKFKDSRIQEKSIRLDIYVKNHQSVPTSNTLGLTRKYKKSRRIYHATKTAVLNVNFKYSPSQKHILA